MALFTQPPRKDESASKMEPRLEPSHDAGTPLAPPAARPERSAAAPARPGESVLAAGLTIEGKIEGNGNERVAGHFKGTVTVKGELTIEPGAKVEGEVSADAVLVGGEVRGQLVAAARVELRESGVLVGDLQAGSLTVAAGSKMRGQVEFGWKAGELVVTPATERGRLPLP